MRRKRWYFAGSVLLVALSAAVSAHAAEEGSAAAQRANDIFKWINFAIVAGLVIWVFAKKLPASFHKNAERISSAISRATTAKEEAERRVREAETKLSRLEHEVAELRETAQRESAAEAERIRALAQTEAAKVDAAGKAEIAAAERAARLHLKQAAAALAVDGAESLLAKQLTAAAQESLVESFAASLDGRPN
jgi:F-type H+-transporting ATPase subunit b